jgi:hypothetical protein
LVRSGLVLVAPPFSFRIRSRYPQIADALTLAYSNHEIAAPDSFIDFDLLMRPVDGLRRFIRPLMNLEIDGHPPFDPLPANQVFPLLEWGMNWCVTSTAHHWVMCHSAVLAKDDLAVILPAPPGSGKSTLCAALMLSGWRLLSDEMALIDPETLALNPFVRPVSLKNASVDLISIKYDQALLTPKVHDTIKGTVAHLQPTLDSVLAGEKPAQPRWLIFPKYQAGTALSLLPMPKSEAMVELARNTFNMAALGPKAFTTLNAVVEQCDCFRLEYSDLDEAIGNFDGLFQKSSRIA